MASDSARKIQTNLEAYLGRGLTPKELIRCEEIVINFKPWVPDRWLDGLQQLLKDQEGVRRGSWALFYVGLMVLARNFRGFSRRESLVHLRGRLRRIYDQCSLMAHDRFAEKDLATILFLTDDCTDREIEAVMQIARHYGLKNLTHVRGIILKNRAHVLAHRTSEVRLVGADTDKISAWARSRYPEINMLKDVYRGRIDRAIANNKPLYFVWEDLEHGQPQEVSH